MAGPIPMSILARPLRQLDGVKVGLELRVGEGLALIFVVRSCNHPPPLSRGSWPTLRFDRRPEENASSLLVASDR